MFYEINRIIFKWLVVYFFVLLFLEDLKESLVSAHFLPHWFLLPMLVSGLVVVLHPKEKEEPAIISINKYDYLAAVGLAFLSFLLVMIRINSLLIGILLGLLVGLVVYFSTIYLIKNV